MKDGKLKRIVAIVGIVLLLSLYLVTLVTAIMAKPYAHQLFIGSIFCSFVIPVLIYAFLLMARAFGKREKNGMSIHDLRRMKKEMNQLSDEEVKALEQEQEKQEEK